MILFRTWRPRHRTGITILGFTKAASRSDAIAVIPGRVGSTGDIEAFMTSLADGTPAGLVVMPDIFVAVKTNLELIIALAERHRLPTLICPIQLYDRGRGTDVHMGSIMSIFAGARPPMSIRFSRAQIPPSCRSNCRQRSSSSST